MLRFKKAPATAISLAQGLFLYNLIIFEIFISASFDYPVSANLHQRKKRRFFFFGKFHGQTDSFDSFLIRHKIRLRA